MRIRTAGPIAVCLFAVIALLCASIPVSAQGDVDQKPLLVMKIPDINKLLQDMTSATSGAVGPSQMISAMLHGTDWIDTNRSMVAELHKEGAKSSLVYLIPFNTPNSSFENAYHPIARGNYYLTTLPAQQGITVSPAFEQSLVNASLTPTTRGDLVVEIAAGKALTDAEPGILAALEKAAAMQPNQPANPPMSQENVQAMVKRLLNVGKQVDIFRLGLDFGQDFLTLNMDMETLPGTEFANALVDVGGSTRLANFPIDMPIKVHTRPYNVAGITDLYGEIYQPLFAQLGVDLQDVDAISKISTGESAGGFNVTPEGLDIKAVSVLKPGTDGESFLINEYVPFLEKYSRAFSNITATETNTPAKPFFVRTDDSTVAGARAIGYSIDLSSLAKHDAKPPLNLKLNFRIAAAKDLMFMASDDDSLAQLINGTRNLVSSPASGPTGRIAIDTAVLFNGLKSLMPPGTPPPPFPLDLGEIEMQFTFSKGKMESETRLDAAALNRMAMAIAAQVMSAKQKPAPQPAPGSAPAQ